MHRRNALGYAAIVFAVAVLDGVLKFLALRWFSNEKSYFTFPIDIALYKNMGIIADVPVPLAIVIPVTVVVCAGLTVLMYTRAKQYPGYAFAAWTIFCGAVGNLIDRIINNFTTDYIIFFARSAINLSDVLIVLGALLLVWYSKNNSPALRRDN